MPEQKPNIVELAEGRTAEARAPSPYFPGIAVRDVALIERVVADLNAVLRGIKSGNPEHIRDVYPRLLKLPREAERIRTTARRAMSRGG